MGKQQHAKVSNSDLLEFIREHVADRLDNTATKDDIKEIRKTLKDHTTSLDSIAKDVRDLKSDRMANDKRISRVEYRTEELLGKKVGRVDAEFEEQYHGETHSA